VESGKKDAKPKKIFYFLFFYLSPVVKQQRYSISVAQVSMDTQQGCVIEDITTIIHIGPA